MVHSNELIAEAENAQDIAAALNKFLDQVPECSAEITGLIAECFAISSSLRKLADASQNPLYRRRYQSIVEDVQLLRLSLRYTFEDVHGFIGSLARSHYRYVWRDLKDRFQEQSRNTPTTRLHYYQQFIDDLIDILKAGAPPDWADFDGLAERIDALLEIQEYAPRGESLGVSSIGARVPGGSRNRSFERRRPDVLQRRVSRPYLQPIDDSAFEPDFDRPPLAPSPTTTTTFSSTNSSQFTHWVPRLFEQSRSTTSFLTAASRSACYGDDIPGVGAQLAEKYEKLLHLPFEKADMLVHFYLHPRTLHAIIYCQMRRDGRATKECFHSLTSLRIGRQDSSIRLYSARRSARDTGLWACLNFDSYERLVLFYCTFLALKAEDTTNPDRQTLDYDLHDEKPLFSGAIRDDHFQHALRLFKDRNSGALRLQASVYSGELKRTPVWTAFITHHVASRRWIRRAGSKIIHLAELQPVIFTDAYTPQLGPQGQHELCFLQSSDAKDFLDVIESCSAG